MSRELSFYRSHAISVAVCILVALIFTSFILPQCHADDQSLSKEAQTEKKEETPKAKKADKLRLRKAISRSVRSTSKFSDKEKESASASAVPKPEEKKSIEDRATHHEVAAITIPQGDQKLPIHTFCIDSKGRLLATCGGARLVYKRAKGGVNYEIQEVEDPASIKILDPQGELLATWKIEITPQSINVAPDGTIFAGGSGKLIKLSSEGKVLKVAETPNFKELPPLPEIPEEEPSVDVSKMTDEEREKHEVEQKAKEEKIEQLNKKRKELSKQLSEIYQKMRAAEKGSDEDEKNRLAGELEKAQKPYAKIYKELRELTTSKRQIAMQKRASALRKRNVPGIAATEEDLFVVCSSAKGYGYEVWRTDHDFGNPIKIAEKLRGCCSQLDIQAQDGKVWVAENSRKRVVCYDREGKELAKWGKDEREDEEEGFGSCCNPMNLRLDTDGNIFTSESGPGTIKKFSPEGKFLGYVAKAKIVPGCKHVALDMNEDGTQLFMLDITRSRILVFEDKTAVTEHTKK